MSAIKSINERAAPLDSEMHVPKIATQAIAEPPKPTTTFYTPEKIIGSAIMEHNFFVLTENGVYVFNMRENIFNRLKFEIVEEPNE